MSADWKTLEVDNEEKYQLYLCSREWAEKRILVLQRCKEICERCHTAKAEVVHHLT